MKNPYVSVQRANGRLTKLKRAILAILEQSQCLVSKQQLRESLQALELSPDRSTLYRELIFLTKNNIITEQTILGTPYFEIPSNHHHIICTKCHRISQVVLNTKEPPIIPQNFRVISHSIEIYGHCSHCQ